MWHLKNITGSLGYDYLAVLASMKYRELHFVEQLIALQEYYEYDWKK